MGSASLATAALASLTVNAQERANVLPREMVTAHLHLDPADISKISADAGVYILPR